MSLLSNTVCACVIFTVEMTKLWNLVQKKKFARAGLRAGASRPLTQIQGGKI